VLHIYIFSVADAVLVCPYWNQTFWLMSCLIL